MLGFYLVISSFYRIKKEVCLKLFDGSICFAIKLGRQNRAFCTFLKMSVLILSDVGDITITSSLCVTEVLCGSEKGLLDTKASTVSSKILSQFSFKSLSLFTNVPSAMSNVRVHRLRRFPTEPSLHLWQRCCWVFKEPRRSV